MNLRHIIIEKFGSLGGLSREVGMDQSYLTKLMGGEPVTREMADKVALALGRKRKDLFKVFKQRTWYKVKK